MKLDVSSLLLSPFIVIIKRTTSIYPFVFQRRKKWTQVWMDRVIFFVWTAPLQHLKNCNDLLLVWIDFLFCSCEQALKDRKEKVQQVKQLFHSKKCAKPIKMHICLGKWDSCSHSSLTVKWTLPIWSLSLSLSLLWYNPSIFPCLLYGHTSLL